MALDFFAGCVGGVAGVIVGHPLDTVKVKIQTQDFRNPIYRGTWHCFTTIIRTESLRGLYRGVTSPMGGVALVNAIVFGVYGNALRGFGEGRGAGIQMAAGAAAGLAQSFVCSPMELAKTRLQVQSTTVYSGSIDCLAKIAKNEGLRGLFKGLGVTILREVPSFGMYFYTYEVLTQGDPSIGTGRMLLAGGLAGTASWIVSYPVDVIKSRIQADGFQGSNKYSGAFDCFKKSIKSEGPGFLFRGLNSTIVRAFPVNAVTFATVAWVFRLAGVSQSDAAEQDMHADIQSLAKIKASQQETKITVKLKENFKNALHYYEDERIDVC